MVSYDSFTDRTPFGAVVDKTSVQFHLHHTREDNIAKAVLFVFADGMSTPSAQIPMTPDGDGLSASYTLQGVGLWFYAFQLTDDNGVFWLGATEGQGGPAQRYADGSEVSRYQITVVSAWDQLPDWYADARFYHIFVDRFYNGNADGHVNDPKPNSFIYGQKTDLPYYIRDRDNNIVRWDFYGGNLAGIVAKLPMLKALGINALYLSPIFEARSNHRYDTGDYLKIDGVLGTLDDFKDFLSKAHDAGFHVVLDGVFNHVGADSRYFNAADQYPPDGAANRLDSPYASWFSFKHFPDDYASWWGVKDLPAINKDNQDFHDFIAGDHGVIAHWTDLGVDGFRLDVADELSESFLRQIRTRLQQYPNRLLIGEVWEDASNKIAYGKRRPYFQDDLLQGVMNYPLRQWLIDFVTGKITSAAFLQHLMTQKENYPPTAFAGNFNNIGTHDTARILTVLQNDLTQFNLIVSLLYWLPGVPVLYYGDEAGVTGGPDPDNRAFYPWGRENEATYAIVQTALLARAAHPALTADSEWYPFTFEDSLGFLRTNGTQTVVALINPTAATQILTDPMLDYVPAKWRSRLPLGTHVRAGETLLIEI